jgi:hypothetical protein
VLLLPTAIYHTHKVSKVLSAGIKYCGYTRALTFENFFQPFFPHVDGAAGLPPPPSPHSPPSSPPPVHPSQSPHSLTLPLPPPPPTVPHLRYILAFPVYLAGCVRYHLQVRAQARFLKRQCPSIFTISCHYPRVLLRFIFDLPVHAQAQILKSALDSEWI